MTIEISPDSRFYGPKLKIERAMQHINELDREITAYVTKKPYRLVVQPSIQHFVYVKPEPDPSRCDFFVKIAEGLPASFSVIAGDAIHNLRAALDLLAGDLVELTTGKKIDAVRFPFATDAEHLEERIKSTKINRAGEKVVNEIRRIEPYLRGKGQHLRALHDIDIEDKHVALLEVVSTGSLPNIFAPGLTMVGCVVVNPTNGAKILENIDMPIFSMLMTIGDRPGDLELGNEIDFPINICIGDGLPFQHQPILPILTRFVSITKEVVFNFENVVK